MDDVLVDAVVVDDVPVDEELPSAETADQPDDVEPLIEEISIDGMCGVY
jgi:mycofactocin precursor